MKIRNRTADVVELRCHICQAFLKMVVVDGWRDTLHIFVKRSINGPYKSNYIEQYKTMRKKGIENYSIDDMDVPFIVNILSYCPSVANFTKSTINALYNLRDDRHITNHSGENEPEEELYLRALVSIRDLQAFLHTVDLNETGIPDDLRGQFVHKYSDEIEGLKLAIYDDCITLFQIKKDVQTILSSKNQQEAFSQIESSYMDRQRLSNECREQTIRFYIEASNAGIQPAHMRAGNTILILYKDIDEATRRYEMAIEHLEKIDTITAHQLTDFVNHIYMLGETPSNRVLAFIKLVKDQGFEIYDTPEGVRWKKK